MNNQNETKQLRSIYINIEQFIFIPMNTYTTVFNVYTTA